MIIKTGRNGITLLVNDREIFLNGEAFLPGHGSPDFVIYSNDIKHWVDTPDIPLAAEEKALIIETLISDAKERNIVIEIE